MCTGKKRVEEDEEEGERFKERKLKWRRKLLNDNQDELIIKARRRSGVESLKEGTSFGFFS